MTSFDGYRTGCLKAGTEARILGKVDASQEESMQNEDTNANWTRVRVAGLLKAVRIDLEDVFVNAEDQYHMMHSIYSDASATTHLYVIEQQGVQ